MALSVTHSTNVVIPDDGTSAVGSDEWNAGHSVSGTLPVANGGTGQTTEAEAIGEMIQALTEETTPVPTDYLAIYDASADTGKKVALSNFVRTKLTADTTFYVRTDGSDSNDGSADTAGSAWLTPQHAYDSICENYDVGGFNVTIKIGNGTYTSSTATSPSYPSGRAVILLNKPWFGSGDMIIEGNLADPTQVYFNTYNESRAGIVSVTDMPGTLRIGGLKVDAGHEGINNQGSGGFSINGDMHMLNCTNGIFTCYGGGSIGFEAGITVTVDGTGGHTSTALLLAESGGSIVMGLMTFALTNTPVINILARAQINGTIFNNGSTWTGNFTGCPYMVRWDGTNIDAYPGVNGFPSGTTAGIVYPDSSMKGRDRIRDLLLTESITSTTDLAVTRDTTEIWGYIEPLAKVNFKFTVWYDTPTAADFKFDLDGQSITPTLLTYTMRYIGPDDTSMTTTGIKTTFNQAISVLATTNTKGWAEIEGVVHNGSTAFDLTFRWAQNTSNGSPTTIYAGSCAIVSRFNYNGGA